METTTVEAGRAELVQLGYAAEQVADLAQGLRPCRAIIEPGCTNTALSTAMQSVAPPGNRIP